MSNKKIVLIYVTKLYYKLVLKTCTYKLKFINLVNNIFQHDFTSVSVITFPCHRMALSGDQVLALFFGHLRILIRNRFLLIKERKYFFDLYRLH